MEYIDNIITAVKEINWALSLLAAIPLSIIANLLTPKVASWWSLRSHAKATRRAEALEIELEELRKLTTNNEEYTYTTHHNLFKVLYFIALGSAISSLAIGGIFSLSISALIYLRAFIIVSRQMDMMRQCKNFSEYEQKMKDEINLLKSRKKP